jgi:hypothetical protein
MEGVFASRFSSFVYHDTVLYYDKYNSHTLFINCYATLDFCQRGMHDTSYDTPIVTSLRLAIVGVT